MSSAAFLLLLAVSIVSAAFSPTATAFCPSPATFSTNTILKTINKDKNDEEEWNNDRNGYSMPQGRVYRYSQALEARGNLLWWGRTRTAVVVDKEENEDGWSDMRKTKRSTLMKLIRWPLKLLSKPFLERKSTEPGILILVRHGESTWNANKTFTGWADPDLSERGYREVEHAARLLLEGGYEIDVVFTSRLKRAIRSTWIILQEMNNVYLPVFKSWRLNERMYGALTGLGKKATADTLGHELVQEWRGSLRSCPPAVKPGDRFWPGKDRKYADLKNSQIPRTESLLNCMERVEPLWRNKILYELGNGKNVMVVAHANTLRGLGTYFLLSLFVHINCVFLTFFRS
jgi:2,3-bisphosphoglycerate-dependent phosphoglycerate mutase